MKKSNPVVVPSGVVASVEVAREKMGTDIRVLDLREVASFTDYFVILAGSSQRQVHALVDAISRRLKTDHISITQVEGYDAGEWVLIDCSDFVVHVFSSGARSIYDLEKLWGDARIVEIPEAAA